MEAITVKRKGRKRGNASLNKSSSKSTSRCGRVLESAFRPHPLLTSAHLQTIAGALRPAPKLELRLERLELEDGDFLDLGWSGEENAHGPIAILIHGLAGSFESKYLRGTASLLNAQGWRTVMLQLRGAGPEPNRLPRCYNQGDTEDLRYFWHFLRELEPKTFIASVGWSLGGNVNLKALAEEGHTVPIDIAAAASVPFDIRPCAERLQTGFSRVYQKHLLDAVKESLRRKHSLLPPSPLVDLDAALSAQNFIDYDVAYTAPLGGFDDVEDYYSEASCGQYLGNIRCSTLVVHALDDPFMIADIVPAAETLSPDVTLEIANNGGHVGFVSAGPYGQPYCWLDQRLAEYLQQGFEQSQSQRQDRLTRSHDIPPSLLTR